MSSIAAKPMKSTIKYQADDNAVYIRLSGGDILESSEVAPITASMVTHRLN